MPPPGLLMLARTLVALTLLFSALGCGSQIDRFASRLEPFDPDDSPEALEDLDKFLRDHATDPDAARARYLRARGQLDWLLYALDREDADLIADLAERVGNRSACAGEDTITRECFLGVLGEVGETFDDVPIRDLPPDLRKDAETGTDLADAEGFGALSTAYVRLLATTAAGRGGMAARALALKLHHARTVLRAERVASADGVVSRLAAAWPFPCPAHFADLPALKGDLLADALEHCDLAEGYKGGPPSAKVLLDDHAHGTPDHRDPDRRAAAIAVAAVPPAAARPATPIAPGPLAPAPIMIDPTDPATRDRLAAEAAAREAAREAAAREAAARALEEERRREEALRKGEAWVPPASLPATAAPDPTSLPVHETPDPTVRGRTLSLPVTDLVLKAVVGEMLATARAAEKRDDPFLKELPGQVIEALAGLSVPAPVEAATMGVPRIRTLGAAGGPAPAVLLSVGADGVRILVRPTLAVGPDGTLGPAEGPAREFAPPGLHVPSSGPGDSSGATEALAVLERAWKATSSTRASGVGLALQGGMKWSDAVPLVRALAVAGVTLHLVASPDGTRLVSIMTVKFVAAESIPPTAGPLAVAEAVAAVVGPADVSLVRWGSPLSLGVTLPLLADRVTDASSLDFALEGAVTLWSMSPTDVKRLLVVPQDGAGAGVVAEIAAAAATLSHKPEVLLVDRLIDSSWPATPATR